MTTLYQPTINIHGHFKGLYVLMAERGDDERRIEVLGIFQYQDTALWYANDVLPYLKDARIEAFKDSLKERNTFLIEADGHIHNSGQFWVEEVPVNGLEPQDDMDKLKTKVELARKGLSGGT